MGGARTNKDILNHTLETAANVFHAAEFKDWFIGYGTLLGIVREDSCIEGDDDIDFLVPIDAFGKVKELLSENNFTFMHDYGIGDTNKIIKTNATAELCSIDVYCCQVTDGSFFDAWAGTTWRDCYLDGEGFHIREWSDTTLHLPKNYEQKLAARYNAWKTPDHSRGAKQASMKNTDLP